MKILFIVPATFLRTVEKTDPFYDPIMRAIDEMSGASWRVLLPRKGMACGYPQEKIGNYKWFLWCSIWFYRFWRLLSRTTPVWKINYCFGKLMRPLFKKTFDADVIITQAGIFSAELAGMFPNKRIVDVQHGVIHSTHSGYFTSDARLVEQYQFTKNREFWVYGKGYADCFFKHPENAKDLEGRVHVIGDLLGCLREQMLAQQADTIKRDAIAFSLQFTNTTPMTEMAEMKAGMEEVFQKIERAGLHQQYAILLKHHPRYLNAFDLSDWQVRFPWLQITDEQTPLLIRCAKYHVTAYSTTAFEYAAEGVPTLYMWRKQLLEGKTLFLEDYAYPGKGTFDEMVAVLANETQMCLLSEKVKAWYCAFYTPFAKRNCVKLLCGNEIKEF